MAKTTVRELESLTAEDHGKTIREDGNLLGKVISRQKGVSVSFYYRFKWDGKLKDYACGTWAKNGNKSRTLSEIRSEHRRASQQVADGIDPTSAKKAAKIEAQASISAIIAEAERHAAENKTFADLFDEWLRDGVSRQDDNAELQRSFKKDVLPAIGKKPLCTLTEKDLLAALRAVRARGLNRTVVILYNDIGQMLRWAEKRKPWRSLGFVRKVLPHAT